MAFLSGFITILDAPMTRDQIEAVSEKSYKRNKNGEPVVLINHEGTLVYSERDHGAFGTVFHAEQMRQPLTWFINECMVRDDIPADITLVQSYALSSRASGGNDIAYMSKAEFMEIVTKGTEQ